MIGSSCLGHQAVRNQSVMSCGVRGVVHLGVSWRWFRPTYAQVPSLLFQLARARNREEGERGGRLTRSQLVHIFQGAFESHPSCLSFSFDLWSERKEETIDGWIPGACSSFLFPREIKKEDGNRPGFNLQHKERELCCG